MATGLCLGAEGLIRASLQAFGPGCSLETCGVAAGLVEGFQPGHIAPGESSWHEGARLQGGPCVLIGGVACLAQASKPASLWHSVFPQIGPLLRNTQSLGNNFSAVLMRLLCLAARLNPLRQAVTQGHTSLPA